MKCFQAWQYLRLSKDDRGYNESESITNQRELISQYMKDKQDLELGGEFVDDGYSGANFQRPAFLAMMKQVQEGKVKCIIVKDLSRLGRDYIEVGKYIERVFPAFDVRFIAVNEGYDSLHQNQNDSILIPVRNVINDSYCRDISTKVKSHLEVKRNQGSFVGPFAVYGYQKDENNKNQLAIDRYAASIVQKIFDLKIHGLSCSDIGKFLNDNGVLSPYEYKKYWGSRFHTVFQKKSKLNGLLWQSEPYCQMKCILV